MPATALLFPGQGAQTLGMGAALARDLPQARALFDQASAHLGYDLLAVCTDGPVERLNATDVSQPAIYVASLAALEQLKVTQPEVLDEVVATAGLSLGEYTALTFAGSLSFEDGLKVVAERGRAMQEAAIATPSGMVSVVGPQLAEVQALIAEVTRLGVIELANILCPGNTVVAGELGPLAELERLCGERGFRAIRLAVAGAFHTFLMQPADLRVEKILATVAVHPPRVPVYFNLFAVPNKYPQRIRHMLMGQVVSPVMWEESMRNMLASGVTRFVEVGPGRVLAGLIKRIDRKIEVLNVGA